MNAFEVVGLENDASRGLFSRHSVGGRLIDKLAKKTEWQTDGKVQTASCLLHGNTVLLLKLDAGKLHEAGETLAPYVLSFADPRRVIVLYDEALLPIGEAALYTEPIIKATHLGIKSLIKVLGNGSFVQGAIGIGDIPTDKDLWDIFFNVPLSAHLKEMVEDTFSPLTKKIEEYIAYESSRNWQITASDMQNAQLPTRRANLGLSPFPVHITARQKELIDKNVGELLNMISQIANKYAHACHMDNNPDQSELVKMLESGIPKNMIPFVRMSGFHADGLSFDIQSGKLIEINASPMPPLTVMNLADRFPIAGEKLTVDMLTTHIQRLAKRAQKMGSPGVLLLDKIGEVSIGRTGWLNTVQEFLENQGFTARIGTIDELDGMGVIWANLTWMTEDRIPSVVPMGIPSQTAIYPSPRNFLFTSKHFLALLHDEHAQEVFELSKGHKTLIQEFVPRTFILSDTLARTLLETKTRWYMKPFLSSGGRGGGTLSNSKSHRKIQRPAEIQEWVEPYQVQNSNYKYDIRVIYYNSGNAKHFVWTARVWYGSETIARPLDALVTVE